MVWQLLLGSIFPEQVANLREVIQERILPCFDDIFEDAEKHERETLERLKLASSSDADIQIVAEFASEAGGDRFIDLRDMKQATMNMMATAIYHLFEQQKSVLAQRGFFPPSGPDDFTNLVRSHGFDLDRSTAWSTIKELELVANVTKHGAGRSAERLYEVKPDLFQREVLRDDPFVFMGPPSGDIQPLAGVGLYVTSEDLANYLGAVGRLWVSYKEHLDANPVV